MKYQALCPSFLSQFNVFLVDASGVLYADHLIEGADRLFSFLQTVGSVFLATNNSYESPPQIHQNLQRYGINIPVDHILSSGYGLTHDPDIRTLLHTKKVYVFGSKSSQWYAKDFDTTSYYEQADAIVLAGTKESPDEERDLFNFVKKNPNIPVICINPDRIVRSGNGFYPVVGDLADRLLPFLSSPITWFGKPLPNYANMLHTVLTQQLSHPVGPHICFFDDNPENICGLQNQLGVTGIWVHQTGIGYLHSHSEFSFGNPDYVVERFSLI
jgi:ribonucleotide monophosphatase NagD (HAD superfamily)